MPGSRLVKWYAQLVESFHFCARSCRVPSYTAYSRAHTLHASLAVAASVELRYMRAAGDQRLDETHKRLANSTVARGAG